jgi:hypothetical protein
VVFLKHKQFDCFATASTMGVSVASVKTYPAVYDEHRNRPEFKRRLKEIEIIGVLKPALHTVGIANDRLAAARLRVSLFSFSFFNLYSHLRLTEISSPLLLATASGDESTIRPRLRRSPLGWPRGLFTIRYAFCDG